MKERKKLCDYFKSAVVPWSRIIDRKKKNISSLDWIVSLDPLGKNDELCIKSICIHQGTCLSSSLLPRVLVVNVKQQKKLTIDMLHHVIIETC